MNPFLAGIICGFPIRINLWINEWSWRRFEWHLRPPLNPYDPPHHGWIVLLIGFKVTLKITYYPRLWPCSHPTSDRYDYDGRVFCWQCSGEVAE